ncbi:MAG: S41 family peptidase [Pseudomonadota bacterium]
MIRSILMIFGLIMLSSCVAHLNTYQQDLDFIHAAILENHPGIYNKQDPQFNSSLKTSYNQAKQKLLNARSLEQYKQVLGDFIKSFHDTHLCVEWNKDDKKNLKQSKSAADIAQFSISILSEDIVWIRLPTFALNTKQEKDFEKLIQEITKLRRNKYIVFDLRGNTGGNTDYGSKVVDSLFGEEYSEHKRCLANKNVYVDWRASEGNLDHISRLANRYSNHWLQSIEQGFKESIAQDKKYYRATSPQSCDLQKHSKHNKQARTQVIVIIDSVNVSAALDFIDELKLMTPSVLLVGKKTKADRLYMELRSISLPSGIGSFCFPIKVYRNRPRLDNKAYLPNVELRDIADTSVLQRVTIEKIREIYE